MDMKTVVLSIVATLAASSSVGSETIKLPAHDGDSGVTVTQALKARHSERAFADKELSSELLSGVLWATVMNFYTFDDDGKIFKDVAATGIAGILKGIGAIK